MPVTKELTIRIEDRPGTLGKAFKVLGDRQVNVVAFQSSYSPEGKALVRFVVDNSITAKKVLDTEHITYTEAEVAQVRLPNRPGVLAQAASRLGEANINITTDIAGSSQSRMHRCWFLALQRS